MARLVRTKNIERVANGLFKDTDERELFLCAVERGSSAVTAVAHLVRNSSATYQRAVERPLWLPDWIDVAAGHERPGALPEHEAGDLYILDLSSTFAVAPLAQVAFEGGLLVDVCAAPGGKGILGRSYCKPHVVLGNEVIRKRTAQLISNYKRCRIDPALVTSCDPKLLARLLEAKGYVVIVDAPCSGQSLALKDLAAPGAFHPATISMNERRQRRILAESSKIVSHGGYLLYSTCTFSREENESNIEWFCETFPDFSPIDVPLLDSYRSSLTHYACYRLLPHHGFGAGAFCCLLRRAGAVSPPSMFSLEEALELIRPVWTSQVTIHSEPSVKRSTAQARRGMGSHGASRNHRRRFRK